MTSTATIEEQEENLEVIVGTIDRIVYYSQDTSYIVFSLNSKSYQNKITCVGYIPSYLAEVKLEGCELEVAGQWVSSKYGRQFSFSQARFTSNEEAFFLSLIKGIGPALMKALKEKFSTSELIHILEREPERLKEVPGIGDFKKKLIVESWQKAKLFRDLYSYFESFGITQITPSLVIKIYNHFKETKKNPIDVISENPYSLTQVKGLGFKTVDKLALALGVDPASSTRLIEGIKYVLEKTAENEGHTFLEKDELLDKIKEELYEGEGFKVSSSFIEEQYEKILDSPPSFLYVTHNRVGLLVFRKMESYIYNRILDMSEIPSTHIRLPTSKIEKLIAQYEKKVGFSLEEKQKEFLYKALRGESQIHALAGYAGTGKTTVLKAFLYCLIHGGVLSSEEIACCAFTGMAARRIREVTGFKNCFTIHSMLKYRKGKFIHGLKNPLPYKLIILDEASMVNLHLFYSLLKAIAPNANFIVVGDPAQLPPIGAGNVFSDMISQMDIDKTELTVIKRQSDGSAITLIANKIRKGEYPKEFIDKDWEDFEWQPLEMHNIYMAKQRGLSSREIQALRNENNEKILKRLLEEVKYFVKEENKKELDIQVLSPIKSGLLGTQNLNAELQKIFNPGNKPSIVRKGIKFKLGDKIINLKNRDVTTLDGSSIRILNGQIGFIRDFLREENKVIVEMLDVNNYEVVLAEEDFGREIDLAYCITVHKSQGSQYPIVIIPMTSSHWYMLNSQWLYTAITRGYQRVCLVGENSAFKRASTNLETKERKTWLSVKHFVLEENQPSLFTSFSPGL